MQVDLNEQLQAAFKHGIDTDPFPGDLRNPKFKEMKEEGEKKKEKRLHHSSHLGLARCPTISHISSYDIKTNP